MTNTERILNIARKEIGTHDDGHGNVKYNTWYYGHPVSGNGFAWCVVFVQWVFEKAGLTLPHLTASCSSLLSWYKAYEPDCVVKRPAPGDLVIFDWPNTNAKTDHIGIVESVRGSELVTIEGNTGIGGKNESNGGKVMRRNRNMKYVVGIIRPRQLEDEMDINQFIKDLTPEQAYKIYTKATDYMQRLPLPVNWNAKEQLAKAVKDGITDGTRPMCPASRLEVALMADRVKEANK